MTAFLLVTEAAGIFFDPTTATKSVSQMVVAKTGTRFLKETADSGPHSKRSAAAGPCSQGPVVLHTPISLKQPAW